MKWRLLGAGLVLVLAALLLLGDLVPWAALGLSGEARDARPDSGPLVSPGPTLQGRTLQESLDEVRPGPAAPNADLRWTIHVVVVDQNGEPRPRISVRALPLDHLPAASRPIADLAAADLPGADWPEDDWPEGDGPEGGLATDKRGEATIPVAGGPQVVCAYDPVEGSSRCVPCSGTECRIVLPRRRGLEVRVTDDSGDPVPDAEVLVCAISGATRFSERATTDSRGRAFFRLPFRERSVHVFGYQPTVGMGRTTASVYDSPVDLVLQGGIRVGFTLTESGSSADQAEVDVAVVDNGVSLWGYSMTVQVNQPIWVGLVPETAHISVWARSSSGAIGADAWQAAEGIRSISMDAGKRLTIHVEEPLPPSLPRIRLTPPHPYALPRFRFQPAWAEELRVRPFDASGTAVFEALPGIPGKWSVTAVGQGRRFDFEPNTFTLDALGAGRDLHLVIKLRSRPGVNVEGLTLDAVTGQALASVEVGDSWGRPLAVSDADGAFQVRCPETGSRTPRELTFQANGYASLRMAVKAGGSEISPRAIEARLVPLDSEHSHSVTVRALDEEGRVVPGVLCAWYVNRLPLGTEFSASTSPPEVRALPSGRATLLAWPPTGHTCAPGTYYGIGKDLDLVLRVRVAQSEQLGTVVVRVRGGEGTPPGLSAMLSGEQLHSAPFRKGEARIEEVPEGSYELSFFFGKVHLPQGRVVVSGSHTRVERDLAGLGTVSVILDAPEDHPGGCAAFLKRASDSWVITAAAIQPNVAMTFRVPLGDYEVEVMGHGAYGSRLVRATQGAAKPVHVALKRETAPARCVLLHSDLRSSGFTVTVQATGPIKKTWGIGVVMEGGRAALNLGELPIGAYDLVVTTARGLRGRALVDVTRTPGASPVQIRLR